MGDESSTLSKDELESLKKKMLQSITNEKFQLVVNYPFIGGIALRLDFVPIRDKRIGTACTDGSRIFFDMDFYLSLSESERCFVLAHETWHCVMLHFLRKQTRDADIFNIATDMEVNNIIKDSSEDSSFHPPQGALFPPAHLRNHSAEEIYEYLIQQAQKNSKNNNSQNDNSNESSSNDSDECSSEDSFSIGGSSRRQSKPQPSNGNKLDGQWDKHTYNNADNQSEDQKHVCPTDRWGEKGYDEDFQPQISEQVGEKMREAVIAEAQKQMRSQGHLPAGIESLVKNYQEPEIRWQEQLAQFVTLVYGDKRHWLPPNRRHVHEEIYLQSRRDERIKVVVAVDTSGSCVGDLPKFFGELESLMNSFGDYEIDVIYCDASIEKIDHFDRNTQASTHEGFKWKGGGGTSFVPPFNYLEENGIIPDCFIYFTDGYGDAPQNPPRFPVLWILTSDGSKDFCNWGTKIRFKINKYEE